MFTRFLLMAACLCSLTALAHADPTADARKGIQAGLDALSAAEKQNNSVFAPSGIYAPDYTATDNKGHVMTRESMAKAMVRLKESQKANHLNMTLDSVRATVQTVNLQGNTATVTYRQDLTLTLATGKVRGTQSVSAVNQSVWKKYGTRWLIERRIAGAVTAGKQTLTGMTAMPGKAPVTGNVAMTGGGPLMRVLNGRTGLSNNIGWAVAPSEKAATQFFHDVSAGNTAAAKADVTFLLHRGDPAAQVADYVKTHGAITKVMFAFVDARAFGAAGLLCELTFADGQQRECQLNLADRIPNTPPVPANKRSEQQKRDILVRGKWYVDDVIFST